MTRKCVRFGNQHQLREAVWLMSQMYRRIKSFTARPLFLQDMEGRLAGELQTRTILAKMAGHLKGRELPDDEALGAQLAESFSRPISEMAETQLPVVEPSDSILDIIRKSVKSTSCVVPVCDEEQRIIGIVDEGQMIRSLGNILHLDNNVAETSSEIPEIKEVGHE